MSHRYDASTKYLFETRLADWLPLTGRTTTAPVRVVNADLSTVTAAADRMLMIEEAEPWIQQIEWQSSRYLLLPERTHLYNTLSAWRHGVPINSLIVLLRPAADGPELTGLLERRLPRELPYLAFRYQVVRLWQLPVETFLGGGLGLVPLAPLSAIAEAELPAVIDRMRQRIEREATIEEAGTLWTAADVLMGLRYPQDMVSDLLRGVQNMKESVTYQAIIEEGVEKGRVEEARQMMLDVGAELFGEPSKEIAQAIAEITDLERLRWLHRRALKADSWQELLATS